MDWFHKIANIIVEEGRNVIIEGIEGNMKERIGVMVSWPSGVVAITKHFHLMELGLTFCTRLNLARDLRSFDLARTSIKVSSENKTNV